MPGTILRHDRSHHETASITSFQKKNYQISLLHIGWCDASATIFNERTCLVKLKAGNKTKIITINQLRHEITTIGNHPFFMWGRKDPIHPMDGSRNMSKKWYDKTGKDYVDLPERKDITGKGKECIQQYILHPEQMHASEDEAVSHEGLGDDWYFNLWNSDNVETVPNGLHVIKTIYDPSPLGFVLPDTQVFNFFTPDGQGLNVGEKPFNGEYHPEKQYFEFYTNSERDAKLKFYETGYRFYHGAKGDIGKTGYLWLATPSFRYETKTKRWEYGYGKCFVFNYNWLSPVQESNRAWGYGIRPVLE